MLSIKSFLRIADTKQISAIFKTIRVNHFTTQTKSDGDSKSEKIDEMMMENDINTPEIEESIEKQENFKLKVESMRNVSRLDRKTPRFKNFSMPFSMKTLLPIDTKSAWSKVAAKIEEEKQYDLTFEQKIKMFMENKQKEIDDYKNMYKNIYFYYEESYLQCFFSF